ncbi:ATP-dependent DNA helicase [Corynebacterium zhongnanshanii]|nr:MULTISPECIES: ATP-dependent DNA helicase [Corynebacterium]QNP93157.1 ATP-dependent DNA helicase [Corynebacterium zhongnanshanii]
MLATAVRSVGGSPRPGQQKMADAVASAMHNKKHVAVQAGTGTGKSLAYLVPAINHAMHSDNPVIVSTATIALQRQLVERDLPRLATALEDDLPRPLEFAILKGRNNYLCLNKIHGTSGTSEPQEDALVSAHELTSVGAQVARLHEWAQETEDGDRDNLERGVSDVAWRQVSVASRECVGASHCPFGDQCFAEHARSAAQQADVIVTNHALLAIDALSDNAVLPEHDVIVVDEAHELEGRVTNVATSELSPAGISIVAKRAGNLLPKDSDAGDRLLAALENWTQTLDEQLNAYPNNSDTPLHRKWDGLPQHFELALTSLKEAAWTLNRSISSLEPDEDKAAERQAMKAATEEIHDTVVRILSITGSQDDVVWLASEEKKNICVAPLSVSDILAQRLFSNSTVVLTSATLALGGKFAAMLAAWGLAKSTTTLDVGTPFDAKKHGILYVASHLPTPGRDGAADAVVDEVAQLINAAGGRTLGLFSSRKAAEYMAEQLRSLSPHKVLLQGEDSLSRLVTQFREDPETCLFGTLGLWQGVDVPGPSLQLVIMDRIPFPRPNDPLMQARQQAAQRAGRNGFMEVAANHASLLMAQGAGRLLRSVTDKGVVAVLDPRLAKARYGSYIRASMPDFWETSDGQVVRGALRRLNESA